MTKFSVQQKYADPEVVKFWQGLQGLQQAEQEMVKRYFPATGHLLDLGCGAGRAVLHLSQKGFAVTGIDLSLPMLLAGRSRAPTMRLSGANLLALPFVNDSFSAAFMFFGALQHIPGRANRQLALQEMARIVRPQGRLILGLDNLAPALICYAYWFKEKLLANASPPAASNSVADTALWERNTHPLIWHLRGLARTLRWRTWPGLIDLSRRLYSPANGPEPGDTQVAQFSRPATPGRVYYHIYRANQLIEDATRAGWRLLAYHTGRELSEGRAYPPAIKRQDKQLFFAFEKTDCNR